VKGNIRPCRDIDDATLAAMHALFCEQFDGVPAEVFREDLGSKAWVLLLQDDDGALCGFSTMDLYDVDVDGRAVSVVYSGDTVVKSDTWRDSALSYYWMGAIDYLRRLHHKERLYWFLIVSGYRTYRFLPVYSETFFPRHDRATPPDVQAIMDAAATARFGSNYDPATGIVRLDHPALLKGRFRGIPENRMQDPHIAFFAARNPGHEEGDELVCFAILAEDELTRLGRRMWKKGRELFPDVETA
jgi:hypothetical protein